MKDLASIVWVDADGQPIACVEKLKALHEALEEVRQTAADALADAVLMGCEETMVRAVLGRIVDELETPFGVQR